MSPKIDERIASLEEKLKQLKTRQARLEARKRALASRRARKDDTRRKILIGATVLARIDRHELDHADLEAWLDAHLTRAEDRALFELPPRSPT
ncbi:MAG: mobilization protein [Acidobacteriota bacterium]|nr:mobilization protein [Acidobacteriota bacterium]